MNGLPAIILLTCILLTAVVALWRIYTAESNGDRLLGIQLIGTTGIAALLVTAASTGNTVWLEVALVLALLAAAITTAMVQLWRRRA